MENQATIDRLQARIHQLEGTVEKLEAEAQESSLPAGDASKALAALEARRATLSAFFDAVPGLCHTVDRDYTIIEANAAFRRAYSGLDQAEVVGRKCYEVNQGLSDVCPECLVQRMFATGEPQTRRSTPGEQAKTGRARDVHAAPVRNEQGEVFAAIEIAIDVTRRIAAEAQIRNSREELRRLSIGLQREIEKVRADIAREIHDELGQALSALKMDLSWIAKNLGGDIADLRDRTDAAIGIASEATRTVHASPPSCGRPCSTTSACGPRSSGWPRTSSSATASPARWRSRPRRPASSRTRRSPCSAPCRRR